MRKREPLVAQSTQGVFEHLQLGCGELVLPVVTYSEIGAAPGYRTAYFFSQDVNHGRSPKQVMLIEHAAWT